MSPESLQNSSTIRQRVYHIVLSRSVGDHGNVVTIWRTDKSGRLYRHQYRPTRASLRRVIKAMVK